MLLSLASPVASSISCLALAFSHLPPTTEGFSPLLTTQYSASFMLVVLRKVKEACGKYTMFYYGCRYRKIRKFNRKGTKVDFNCMCALSLD